MMPTLSILRSRRNLLLFCGGMTLIEVIIAIAVVSVAFGGFAALFQASLRYVASARAREAAVSLAVERLEEMRATAYADIGTVSGIPAGAIAQNEAVTQDGRYYNRRTFVQYVDDPADGSGALDGNGIAADYNRAKVEVSWPGVAGTSSVALISNFIPEGVEAGAGQGTLSITAIDAAAAPIADATVHIVNESAVPAIDVTTYTDAFGQVLFPGTPAASAFEITVSKPGYSTAQTYETTGGNPNPNPGHLTVSVGTVTSASFAIDALASLLVRTWEPILAATTTDAFADAAGIAGSAHTVVSGGALALDTDGSGDYFPAGLASSTLITPTYLSRWSDLSWSAALPVGTSLLMRLYIPDGAGGYVLLPDAALSGNSAGFSASPVSFSGVSTSTYPSLAIGAELATTDPLQTPAVLDWSLSYRRGPVPLANASFTLQGTKTIGTDGAGASIYKVSEDLGTDTNAEYETAALEWDSYALTVDPATGYDRASSCPFQPVSVSPGSSVAVDLYLVAHTPHSLAVSVLDAGTGAPVIGASVELVRTGFGASEESDACGGAFFADLTSAADYTLTVNAPGYAQNVQSAVSISDQSFVSVLLAP